MKHNKKLQSQNPTENSKLQKILIPAVIFLLALIVRFAFLYQFSSSPTFDTPIVDCGTYHKLAADLAHGKPIDQDLFWQPFLYPFMLSKIYQIFGPSPLIARCIQMLLGSLTCLLVYQIAHRLFNIKTAVIAALITVFYAPLFFFESQLLATGMAAFFSVALILSLIITTERKTVLAALIFGTIAALAILTRPTFVPFIAAVAIWFLVKFIRERIHPKSTIFLAIAAIIPFAVILTAVALISYSVTNRFSPLPRSGPVNLYIGNNPDTAKTLNIRPTEWKQFLLTARRNGSTNEYSDQAYFMYLFRKYIKEHPAHFVKGLAQKTFQLTSPRELPRNSDIYTYRKYSSLLKIGVWKLENFAFPFGLLFPLALIGIFTNRRNIPAPIIIFILFYSFSVILVFVTSRYRIPIIPLLAICAAAALTTIVNNIKNKLFTKAGLLTALTALIALVTSIPGPFATESVNYPAEMHCLLGAEQYEKHQYPQAIENFKHAIELNPDYTYALSLLGLAFAAQNQFDLAIQSHKKAIDINPACARTYDFFGQTLAAQNKHTQAIEQFRKALELDPYFDTAYYDWGASLTQLGQSDDAIELYKKAQSLIPRNDLAHNFAIILAATKDDKLRNPAAAMYFALLVQKNADHPTPENLYCLAAAYAANNDFSNAETTANQALVLAHSKARHSLAIKIAQSIILFKQNKPLFLDTAQISTAFD